MDYPISVWLVITIILGLLATAAIWARGFSRARGLAVAGFVMASPVAAVALGFSLGWPVPWISGVTIPAGEHPILGAKIIIGDGIYILVDRGIEQPRYYRMPWDEEMANKLQGALDEKGEGGQSGVTAMPFEWSWNQHPPEFWAKPQPKILPDKPAQEEAPRYESEA